MNMKAKMMNKAIILMSGGLDSLVALGYCKNNTNYDIDLALTFDYGQKAVEEEISTSKKICNYYNIKHEIIKLDWLKDITKTALVSSNTSSDNEISETSSVWVPNRNSLFLNIAACYADSFNYKYIIFGANKDEANSFPDNTEEFRAQVSECFKTSTLVQPQVVAPLINYSKDDIVKIAVENTVPLEFVRSCYNSGTKHCGKCKSCNYLKKALLANNCEEYIKILF